MRHTLTPSYPSAVRTHRAAASGALAAAACVGTAALLIGACVPASPSDAGAPPLLLVANGLDGTISRLAAGTGRVVGPAVAAGPAPWHMVPGPRGAVLVQAAGASASPSELTFVPPAGEAAGSRPVLLGDHAQVVAIAGNGGRYAAAIYLLAEPGGKIQPCQLALIDLVDGGVERSYTLCTEREKVFSVAVGEPIRGNGAVPAAGDGAVAYVGLRREVPPQPLAYGRADDVLLMIDLSTGARLAAAALPGAPECLVWGPSPDHAGPRLYAVVRWPDRDPSEGDAAEASGGRYALLRFEPVELAPESELPLSRQMLWLTVTPDGRRAVAIAGLPSHAGRTVLMGIDLSTGAESVLVRLPGLTTGLSVAGGRVYVPRADGDAVWIGTLQGGTIRTVRVGQHPLGIVPAVSTAAAAAAAAG